MAIGPGPGTTRSEGRQQSGASIQPAIWAREVKPSLFMMLRTWLSTVRSEMNRRAPRPYRSEGLAHPADGTGGSQVRQKEAMMATARRSAVELPTHVEGLADGDPAEIGGYRLVGRLGAGGQGI